jgi:COX assembly protein 1
MAGDRLAAEVPAKAEEALRSKMKLLATKNCDHKVKDFVRCSQENGLMVVWTCRQQNREMNDCGAKYTNDEVLEDVKRQWVRAGKPSRHDWMPHVPADRS